MDLIHKNPFRILGLPVTATEKEIAKRISDLSIITEIGKSRNFDTDFPCLSYIRRTPETIKEASSQIEQTGNKLFCSLFWFWKNNSVDELSFDMLIDGKIEKAIALWEKSIQDGNITKKNYSNARNLALLYLSLSQSQGIIRHDYLTKGLQLSAKVLTKENLSEYCIIVAGPQYPYDRDKINRSFIDEFYKFAGNYVESLDGNSVCDLMEASKSFSENIGQYLIEKLISKPKHNIEKNIEGTKEKRKDNPYNAVEYGRKLYELTQDDLYFLKNTLTIKDLHYQVIADKIAGEILQCSIDFFRSYKGDIEYEQCDESLKVSQLASRIVVGERVKEKIDEDISVTKRWLEDLHVRKEIDSNFEYISSQLDDIEIKRIAANKDTLLTIAHDLVYDCKPKLLEIKKLFGIGSEKIPLLIVDDKFIDNRNKWPVRNSSDHSLEITDGKYIIDSINRESTTEVWTDSNIGFSCLDDFTIECCVEKLKGQGNVISLFWGKEIINNENTCNFFTMTHDGYCKVGSYPLDWGSGSKWEKCPHINDSAPNRLIVKKAKNKVEYFINDNSVHEQIVNYFRGYNIGIFINPKMKIAVKYIRLYDSYVTDFNKVRNYNLYLSWSSSVVNTALDLCNSYSNETHDHDKALNFIESFSSFDILPELRGRINENKEIIKKTKLVSQLIDWITYQLKNVSDAKKNSYSELIQFPTIAKNLIANCKNPLLEIKNELGHADSFYLKISSAVANSALGMCIDYANATKKYEQIMDIVNNINNLDMEPELRNRYFNNQNILNENLLHARVSRSTTSKTPCYVATMAFGDHCAPELMILRQFRDCVLNRYRLGRAFVKAYYNYSPYFVKRFENSRAMKKIVRFILKGLTEALKK